MAEDPRVQRIAADIRAMLEGVPPLSITETMTVDYWRERVRNTAFAADRAILEKSRTYEQGVQSLLAFISDAHQAIWAVVYEARRRQRIEERRPLF